jgi:hypothetical protein
MKGGPAQPELIVIVDTEEEFDWRAPFSRDSVGTSSIPAQARAHELFDRWGVVPTYVIDYPVAADPAAVSFLGGLRREGRAEIGAHLHPWVTPPLEENVSARNSYACNLPPALERRKLEVLTETITANFGERPRVFKAGRYGFGHSTRRNLVELGYKVDCSFMPHESFARDGGPSYYRAPTRPVWLDRESGLLELPMSSGFIGCFPMIGPRLGRMFDSRLAARLRVPGLLGRSGVVARSRLTPEGVSAREQCALIRSLYRQGQRLFTLTYHSPSLVPGNTPYVRDEEALGGFLERIGEVLAFFAQGMGGRFTTPMAVYERERAGIEGREERRAVRYG